MKIKTMAITIILNIFLVLLVTVYQEYADLGESLKNLNNIVEMSVDMAVQTAMASEEFFSEDFATSNFGSHSINLLTSDKEAVSSFSMWRNGSWQSGNIYAFAEYAAAHGGKYPMSSSDLSGYGKPEQAYKLLFGGTGSDWSNSQLAWANLNTLNVTDLAVVGSDRSPTTEFEKFYDSIGNQITATQFVKTQAYDSDGSITWNFNEASYPVLDQMGLLLDDVNEADSLVTSGNFAAVTHYGKYLDGTAVHSKYYLTPYSLGVTYLPMDILKPLVNINMENMIRFSKCKTLSTHNPDGVKKAYNSANGCIDSNNILADADGGTPWQAADLIPHTGGGINPITGISSIMNDGNIEYDMSTLQVKVDYFKVDFYDDKNYRIVNEVLGATPNADLGSLPTRLKNTDTSEDKDGNRIVAKIDVKIKIHVPYKAYILKACSQLTAKAGDEHYDIPLFLPASDSISETESGLWYTYTTYAAVSR